MAAAGDKLGVANVLVLGEEPEKQGYYVKKLTLGYMLWPNRIH